MKDKLLTKADIDNLIAIGKIKLDDSEDRLCLIQGLRGKDFINRLSYDTWYEFTDKLSDDNLIFLFYGLVRVENELVGWSGGSVAAGIWVYKAVESRGLDTDNRIADFAISNCDNPYIPFGMKTQAKSTEGFYLDLMMRQVKRNAGIEKVEKLQMRAKGRREKRKKATAELRKLDFDTRGKICRELKEKYADASYKEKLALIADDEKYPPEYYPWEWTIISDEEIAELPEELIKKLYDRLIKTKGPWRRLAVKVEKYDDGY